MFEVVRTLSVSASIRNSHNIQLSSIYVISVYQIFTMFSLQDESGFASPLGSEFYPDVSR